MSDIVIEVGRLLGRRNSEDYQMMKLGMKSMTGMHSVSFCLLLLLLMLG